MYNVYLSNPKYMSMNPRRTTRATQHKVGQNAQATPHILSKQIFFHTLALSIICSRKQDFSKLEILQTKSTNKMDMSKKNIHRMDIMYSLFTFSVVCKTMPTIHCHTMHTIQIIAHYSYCAYCGRYDNIAYSYSQYVQSVQSVD